MYYLIMWDKAKYSAGEDGCLRKLNIPITLARILFDLDPSRFPLLSTLSFDDFDQFSDQECEVLIEELLDVAPQLPSFGENIKDIINFIRDAQKLDKSILFDPFRSS